MTMALATPHLMDERFDGTTRRRNSARNHPIGHTCLATGVDEPVAFGMSKPANEKDDEIDVFETNRVEQGTPVPRPVFLRSERPNRCVGEGEVVSGVAAHDSDRGDSDHMHRSAVQQREAVPAVAGPDE